MQRSTYFVSAFVIIRRKTSVVASAANSKCTISAASRAMENETKSKMTTDLTFEKQSESYRSLLEKLRTVTHIERSSSILNYDRQVFMPQSERSATQRGKLLATLATIAHEKATDPLIGKLLDEATKDWNEIRATRGSDADTDEDLLNSKRILELEKDAYKKAICIPAQLAARKAELEASAYAAWVKARQNKDFALFAPSLRDCFDTAIEIANLQRGQGERKDVSLYSQMLDEFEMGMAQERIDSLFSEVQAALVPLIAEIKGSKTPNLDPLSGNFPIDAQKEVCRKIVTTMGFDESHGRIDVSVHPFTMSFSNADVRITSRFNENEWLQGLMGTIHEGGHAMYEQNLRGDSDVRIDSALSMGVHESQSLFWERHIGKSRAFYEWTRPILKEAFGEKFDYSVDELYAAVNAVDFTPIRVDADEFTYPLHVILRYNIERDVIAGNLDVSEIPDRWNKDMKELLGIDVPNDAQGVLQDIHWSCLAIGYFPTYLLGSMMAAQLAFYCKKDIPGMEDLIRRGEFEEIKNWLTAKVHIHGRRYRSLDDLMVAQLGERLQAKYFIDYLTYKKIDLY